MWQEHVWQEQTVSEMVVEVLALQAKALVNRTNQPFEDALVAILKTDDGRQLVELADEAQRHEKARAWLSDMVWKNAEKRHYWWLDDYIAWLENEEARKEYQAFLHQAIVPLKR